MLHKVSAVGARISPCTKGKGLASRESGKQGDEVMQINSIAHLSRRQDHLAFSCR